MTDTRHLARADAERVRDIAIECMGRLDESVRLAKLMVLNPAHFDAYRRACGMVMGELVDVINRVAAAHPELKPTDVEWRRVLAMRRPGYIWPERDVTWDIVSTEIKTVRSRIEVDLSSPGTTLEEKPEIDRLLRTVESLLSAGRG